MAPGGQYGDSLSLATVLLLLEIKSKMAVRVLPSGPCPADILIVGEAPGSEEERQGIPFVGPSGSELNRMLHEVGISRSECFVTNVVRERPYDNKIEYFIAPTKKAITKDHILFQGKHVRHQVIEGVELLKREIEMVKPKIIIALGNTSLWALTGLWGITRWHGSMLTTEAGVRLLPTYHPALILRQWEFRAIAVNDLRRAAKHRHHPYPTTGWQFRVRPSFSEVLETLEMLMGLAGKRAAEPAGEAEAVGRASEPGAAKPSYPVNARVAAGEPSHAAIGTGPGVGVPPLSPGTTDRQNPSSDLELSVDLETRAGHIDCCGIAWDIQNAISIPFMCLDNPKGYWSEDEEVEIVWRLYKLLTHPGVLVIGQNFLYDAQYIYRHWLFAPPRVRDTMIRHHVAFCALPKRLDFQASMYCEHYAQWKPERGKWKEGG